MEPSSPASNDYPTSEPIRYASTKSTSPLVVQMHAGDDDRPLMGTLRSYDHQSRVKVSCSLCCRPVSGVKFLVGREEDADLTHYPSYMYVHELTWSCEGRTWESRSRDNLGLSSGLYHLNTGSGDPSFVLDVECCTLVSHFMADRLRRGLPRVGPPLCNPEELYAALKIQFLRDPQGQEKEMRLNWPQNSFVDSPYEWTFDRDEYMWMSSQLWLNHSGFEPIPSLPRYIFSKLEPITDKSLEKVSYLTESSLMMARCRQSSAFLGLPAELIQSIADLVDFASVRSMRESCYQLSQTIELDQRFWYTRLVRNELFGFLFGFRNDVVIKEIKSKAIARRLGPNEMDWIQLVRGLSQFSSFTSTGCFKDAPPGFRNRRRIWKILETMEQSLQ